MTQQYLIGQLSVLLEDLQRPPSERLASAVGDLRRKVERSPLQMLPKLAHDGRNLTDVICWDALKRGDTNGFGRYANAAVTLAAFSESAGLMDY